MSCVLAGLEFVFNRFTVKYRVIAIWAVRDVTGLVKADDCAATGAHQCAGAGDFATVP